MRGQRQLIAGAAVLTVVLGGAAGVAVANDAGGGPRLPGVCTPQAGGTTKIATAKLIIEFNSTDDDLGVHEFSMADLEKAFPDGMDKVRGRSFDGTVLTGQAHFTHDVPAPPKITSPKIADEPEQPGTPVPGTDLTIGWDRVSKTVEGDPVKITGYEVIVTKEVPGRPARLLATHLRRAGAGQGELPKRPGRVPRTRHGVRAGGVGP
jgi:hypothetical protein